jgi:hypothetical protein
MRAYMRIGSENCLVEVCLMEVRQKNPTRCLAASKARFLVAPEGSAALEMTRLGHWNQTFVTREESRR